MAKRIVIIEDEIAVCQNIKQTLAFEGFEVHTANDGLEGIQVIRDVFPDLIISDIAMPGLDGYEVLEILKRDFETAAIPFIFLTAYADRHSLRKGMDLGADDYIPKPFSSHELVTAVRTRLERKDVFEASKLRAWTHRLLDVKDREQHQLVHVINDEIIPHLTGLRVLLEMNRRNAPGTALGLTEAVSIIDTISGHLESITSSLLPYLLTHLGLLPALLQLFNRFEEKHGIEVVFSHQGLTHRFPAQIEKTIFQTVLEALNNIAQHTSVTQATVHVWYERDSLRVQIKDEGAGFKLPNILESEHITSLTNLSEQVRSLGGTFDINSAPGEGTLVSATLPGGIPVTTLDLTAFDSQTMLAAPVESTPSPANHYVSPETRLTTKPERSHVIRVVLAEPHTLTQHGLCRLLENEPDIALVAATQRTDDTCEAIHRFAPDIVIIDRNLSTTVLEQLSERGETAHTLVLSQYADEAYALEALQRGATGFVLKECAADELLEAVREVAAGKRYISQIVSDRMTDYLIAIRRGAQPLDAFSTLTAREREVFDLVIQGCTSAEIADMLTISPRTVETHRANLMRKVGVRNQAELIRYAAQRGLISTDT